MKLRYVPGDMVGLAFLKLYTPGDYFVLLRYWPVWSISWWRSLWRQRHTMRRFYLEWTDMRAFGMTQYIAFGFPVWFYLRTESQAWNHFGKNRGKHLLVVRGMFRIWPLWPIKARRRIAHIEVFKYPIGEQEKIDYNYEHFRQRQPVPMDVQ